MLGLALGDEGLLFLLGDALLFRDAPLFGNATVLFGASLLCDFLFVRDPSSGMDLALWDCTRTRRPDASQCLPTGAAAVSRMMRINND